MVRVTRRLAVSLVLAAGTFSSMATGPAWGAPPANDEAANATVISSLPFSGTADTTEATIGPGDVTGSAACGLSTPFPKSVFYQYTPSTDQVVRVDVSQSSYSAGVGVFAGDACVTTFPFSGTFSAHAGQPYLIAVVDIGDGTGGTLRLAVSVLEPPGEPTIALPRHAKLAHGGAAVSVSVRYSCDGGFPAVLGVQLTQRHGRRVAQGFGYEFSPVCDGGCHRADVFVASSADEPGEAVPFKPGEAVATATLDQFADPFGAFSAQDGPQKIRLHKK
jgi:hypothetical protein